LSEAESVISLADSVSSYLKRKDFARRPHIALLGVERRSIGLETSLLPEEFFEEHLEEEALQRLIPNITGYRITLEKTSEPAQIKITYSFFVRIAPPSFIGRAGEKVSLATSDQFRYVKLGLEISGGACQASLRIMDGARQVEMFSDTLSITVQNNRGRVEIPVKHFSEALTHLATLDRPYLYAPKSSGLTGNDAALIPNFALSFSLAQKDSFEELSVHLENLSPRLLDRKTSKEISDFLPSDSLDAENSPWTMGVLLEFEGSLDLQGYKLKTEEKPHGILGITTINSVFADSNLFRDYVIVRETAKKIKQSPKTSHEVFSAIIAQFVRNRGAETAQAELVSEAVSTVLEKLGARFPYTFQERSVKIALDSIERAEVALAITARTASGKTLAFLIPILADAISRRARGEPEGVKALLFYPTKALCHDQADTVLKFLWQTNLYLKRKNFPFLIRMGILHGDTPSKWDATAEMQRSGSSLVERELRYKCPECGSRLLLRFTAEQGAITEKVLCSGSAGRKTCPLTENLADPELVSLLNQILRPSRESVFSAPPDVLITNPDMINIRLFWNPGEQTILGREVRRCKKCGFTTTHLDQRKCAHEWCRGDLDSATKFSYPRIIVFDEAHQQRGSFGSQVSYMISRLEEAVRALNGLERFEPLYIFSSATLRKPEKFIPQFLGRPVKVEQIKAEEEEEEEVEPRIHLFLLPKGYSPQATLVQAIRAIFHHYLDKVGRYPNIMAFVNKLSEANELIYLVQDIINDLIREEFPDAPKRLGEPVVNGHSTDWGRRRAEVEDQFSKGKINVLIATRGLEVGVDFDRIDALIIYGAPFYVSDYVQRIGRAGRKQPALIVNICLDKPVDFFFYRQYRVITQASLREKALTAEWMNVTRDNSVIRERSIARGILDYLCTRDGSWRYYSEVVRGKTGLQNLQTLLSCLFGADTANKFMDFYRQKEPRKPSQIALNPSLLAYVVTCVGQLSHEERSFCLSFAEAVLNSLDFHPNLATALQKGDLDGIFFLRKLRDTDYDVEVDYEDLRGLSKFPFDWKRPRALGVAVSDYMPAQITSFRRLFFIVDQVEGDLREGEKIKRALKG